MLLRPTCFSKIGDRILRINGDRTDHLQQPDATMLLRQLNGPITFHVFTPNAERHSLSTMAKRSTEGSYMPGNLIGYQTTSMNSLAMSQMSTLSTENSASRISQLLEHLPHDKEKHIKWVGFFRLFPRFCSDANNAFFTQWGIRLAARIFVSYFL